jgi:hypothetical protein
MHSSSNTEKWVLLEPDVGDVGKLTSCSFATTEARAFPLDLAFVVGGRLPVGKSLITQEEFLAVFNLGVSLLSVNGELATPLAFLLGSTSESPLFFLKGGMLAFLGVCFILTMTTFCNVARLNCFASAAIAKSETRPTVLPATNYCVLHAVMGYPVIRSAVCHHCYQGSI